jgi:hypothetical protein
MYHECHGVRRPAMKGRLADTGAWVIPGVVLAILPKCPVCVAAYVAVGTGVGISLTAASFLRTTVIALCVAALAFMVIRTIARHVH